MTKKVQFLTFIAILLPNDFLHKSITKCGKYVISRKNPPSSDKL